jgi:hypothetical protein
MKLSNVDVWVGWCFVTYISIIVFVFIISFYIAFIAVVGLTLLLTSVNKCQSSTLFILATLVLTNHFIHFTKDFWHLNLLAFNALPPLE